MPIGFPKIIKRKQKSIKSTANNIVPLGTYTFVCRKICQKNTSGKDKKDIFSESDKFNVLINLETNAHMYFKNILLSINYLSIYKCLLIDDQHKRLIIFLKDKYPLIRDDKYNFLQIPFELIIYLLLFSKQNIVNTYDNLKFIPFFYLNIYFELRGIDSCIYHKSLKECICEDKLQQNY